MDFKAKGAIVGLTQSIDKMQIYRACMEGVTFEMMKNIECLGSAGIKVSELRCVGGGARSKFWLQLNADMMGVKVSTLDNHEAGTLGAAIFAASAGRLFKSVEAAADCFVKVKDEFFPNAGLNEVYREKYSRYAKLYPALRKII